MREIKFRAWDGEKFRFFSVRSGLYGVAHDAPIGQYTGLKDKNGTEIFEGDILKGQNSESYATQYIHVAVEWRDYLDGWYLGSLVGGTREVVGNIHENPELLNS